MTQTNPFAEPRFPNIPPFSLIPTDAPEDEAPESEESSPFPEPPDSPDTKDSSTGGN